MIQKPLSLIVDCILTIGARGARRLRQRMKENGETRNCLRELMHCSKAFEQVNWVAQASQKRTACLWKPKPAEKPERKIQTATIRSTSGGGTVERPGTSGEEGEEGTTTSAAASERVPRSCEAWTNWSTFDCRSRGARNREERGARVQREQKAQGVKTYAEAARKWTSKDQEHTETQPMKTTLTMRLWEGAWPKDAAISHFKLKHALEVEEHISARVAMVHPDAVCELQTTAKAHGCKDAKLALAIADVANAPAGHKVA